MTAVKKLARTDRLVMKMTTDPNGEKNETTIEEFLEWKKQGGTERPNVSFTEYIQEKRYGITNPPPKKSVEEDWYSSLLRLGEGDMPSPRGLTIQRIKNFLTADKIETGNPYETGNLSAISFLVIEAIGVLVCFIYLASVDKKKESANNEVSKILKEVYDSIINILTTENLVVVLIFLSLLLGILASALYYKNNKSGINNQE